MKDQEYDVIIVGAGQAGLALGYYLRNTNLSYLLIDQVQQIGDSWRKRYDSLILFSPRAYSALPGMKLQGDQDGFPTKNELADYIEQYAKQFHLPVNLETEVKNIQKIKDNFKVTTTKDIFTAKNVVIATGAFQKPFIPKDAHNLSTHVFQIHAKDYRNPRQIPKGTTVVIGVGNSGAQIAVELAKERKVILSSGHTFTLFPKRILGKSYLWWWNHLGLIILALKISGDNPFGKLIRKRMEQRIIGTELKDVLKNGAVQLKPRAIHFEKKQITFADNSTISANNIIWATGYQQNFHFIDIPGVLDKNGKPIHHRGITNIPGFYFLGLYWLYTVGSAVFLGIANDANYIAEDIIKKTTKA